VDTVGMGVRVGLAVLLVSGGEGRCRFDDGIGQAYDGMMIG
jgi:hypothetical protein